MRLANLLSKRRLALQLMNTEEEGSNGDAMQSLEWRAVQEGFRLLEKDLGKLQVSQLWGIYFLTVVYAPF